MFVNISLQGTQNKMMTSWQNINNSVKYAINHLIFWNENYNLTLSEVSSYYKG